MGLLVVVAAVIGMLMSAGIPERVACGVQGAVATISGDAASPCDAGGATAEADEPDEPAEPVRPGQPLPLPEGWEPNGCGPAGNDAGNTVVVDSGPYFDFGAACDAHDACYKQQRGKDLCDHLFLRDMLDDCKGRWWKTRDLCASHAYAYFQGVQQGAHGAYEAAAPG